MKTVIGLLCVSLLSLVLVGCGLDPNAAIPLSDGGVSRGEEGGVCWSDLTCNEDYLQCLSGHCVAAAVPSCDESEISETILIDNVPWLPQVPVNQPGTNGGCWSCSPPANCWAGCPGTCITTAYCGPTATAMLSGWASNSAPTPDSLYALGLWASQNLRGGWNLNCGSGDGTNLGEIEIILRDYFGMTPQESILYATLCDINNALKRGHPVIVGTMVQNGVTGPDMRTTCPTGYFLNCYHWMVVVGISPKSIWVNDPGRPDELNGKGKQYSLSSFRQIWYSTFRHLPIYRIVLEATGR